MHFSVRGLVVLVLLIAVVLGWIVHRAHVQRDAVAAIKQAGGSVLYDWQYKDGRRVDGGRPAGPKWLGPDYFDTVTWAEAGPKASDPELAHIGRLTRLAFLNFSDAPAVTDAGLAHLAGLTQLCEMR